MILNLVSQLGSSAFASLTSSACEEQFLNSKPLSPGCQLDLDIKPFNIC